MIEAEEEFGWRRAEAAMNRPQRGRRRGGRAVRAPPPDGTERGPRRSVCGRVRGASRPAGDACAGIPADGAVPSSDRAGGSFARARGVSDRDAVELESEYCLALFARGARGARGLGREQRLGGWTDAPRFVLFGVAAAEHAKAYKLNVIEYKRNVTSIKRSGIPYGLLHNDCLSFLRY